jgi:transcriptional regulator with XRE-family HTH domain
MQRNAPVQEEMNFSLILRDLRRKLGLTQAEMALKLKISCTTLSGWETDKHRPMRAHATRIVNMARRAGVLEAPRRRSRRGSISSRAADCARQQSRPMHPSPEDRPAQESSEPGSRRNPR